MLIKFYESFKRLCNHCEIGPTAIFSPDNKAFKINSSLPDFGFQQTKESVI